MCRYFVLFPGIFLLAACGGGGGEATAPPTGITPEPGGMPPGLMTGSGGTAVTPGGNLEKLMDSAGAVLSDDDILYTDMDAEDPGAALPELRELLAAGPQEGPWRESYTNAFREARQTGKPVLIWFTDSKNSPPCKALAEELFNRQDFEEWAGENLVRLRVDVQISGNKLTNEASLKLDFVKDLRKRYNVRGTPTLIMATPAEDVIGRYKGYSRGQAEFTWGQVRLGAKTAVERHEQWISGMEKKGYRTWSDPRGRKLFAKLLAYRDGELILVEPDGTRARTKERHLSVEDQDWIAARKRERGIQ